MKYVKLRIALGIAVLAVLLALMGCRAEGGAMVRANPQTFTAADENRIGETLLVALARTSAPAYLAPATASVTDSAYDYLAPLLRAVSRQPAVTRRDSFAWSVHLLHDREPLAYTLPGGRIVVHTALLHAVDSEAELIGLLAREVALAETGAAMAALDRSVEDNVVLGDLLLGNDGDYAAVVAQLPDLHYTPEETAEADLLAAEIICNGDYEERALTGLVARLPAGRYTAARPVASDWAAAYARRVAACPGADSLYARRYRSAVEAWVPR